MRLSEAGKQRNPPAAVAVEQDPGPAVKRCAGRTDHGHGNLRAVEGVVEDTGHFVALELGRRLDELDRRQGAVGRVVGVDGRRNEERGQADVQDRVVFLGGDGGHRSHEGKIDLALQLAVEAEDPDDVGVMPEVGDVESLFVQHDVARVGAGGHGNRLLGFGNHLTQVRQSRFSDVGGHDPPVG